MDCGSCLRFKTFHAENAWLGHCRVYNKNVSMPDRACLFYMDENLLKRFSRLFVHRRDTYAVQREDGSYMRLEEPLTLDVLKRHQVGDGITVGIYQINPVNNTVKWVCFDVDPEHVENPWQVALILYNECVSRFPKRAVLLEASRWPDPSFHVWVFFEPEFPAKAARWLGQRILDRTGVIVELFPKQSEVNPRNFGNCVKLPCGYHREAKKWSTFLTEDRTPIGVKALGEIEGCTLSERDIERILKLVDKKATSACCVQTKLGTGTVYKGKHKVRPCFKEALRTNDLRGEKGHLMRLAVAVEYLCKGYNIEQVVDLFRKKDDFDERKARYQVKHAQERGYQPRKCSTIQALGFCLGEACPIFRKRQKHFEKTVEVL